MSISVFTVIVFLRRPILGGQGAGSTQRRQRDNGERARARARARYNGHHNGVRCQRNGQNAHDTRHRGAAG
ncbi:hypothetical protein GGR56DRAFT_661813 [Xylariaceae sp. FL0804]|nr:hypothetical protein GGR56DRAFT_661813 [Xylariaceae sp. FL0804]